MDRWLGSCIGKLRADKWLSLWYRRSENIVFSKGTDRLWWQRCQCSSHKTICRLSLSYICRLSISHQPLNNYFPTLALIINFNVFIIIIIISFQTLLLSPFDLLLHLFKRQQMILMPLILLFITNIISFLPLTR
jgi:hypothetical protein